MNIVVLAGGLSTERDVSFKTGSMVAKALKENGHKVILLDVFMGYSDKEEDLTGIFDRADEISVQVSDIPTEAPDLAKVKASRKDQSPCFFGPNGVKYTGSDYLSSAIAMNKETSKQFFLANGIPTPKGISMTRATRQDDITKLDLTLPCVVKPCCGGSSIGVTIVRDAAEFKAALDDAFKWENELVIEEFVQGREFSVGVIEGKALPIIEIAPKEGFYDYKNKYKAGSTVETCPAELPEQVTKDMQHYAEEVARVIGLDTYSRSDFLLNDKNEMFCLEANTLPGMTPTSLLPQEAAVIGMSFNQLCEHLINISLKKYEV